MHGVFFRLLVYKIAPVKVGIALYFTTNTKSSIMRCLPSLVTLLLAPFVAQSAETMTCDGLSIAQAKTADHFCVGIVATGFKAPRAVLPLPDGDLIVADMGNWEPGKGSIWHLHKQDGGYARMIIADKLDRPNALALGPDGQVYFTLARRVLRFDPRSDNPAIVDVIGGRAPTPALPSRGRHILSGVVFDKQGNLFVSVGSASDHCEADDGRAPGPGKCAEGEGTGVLGAIRHYKMQWPAGTVTSWETYATGLRNAMAMAIDPGSGKLWQAENSRDNMQLAMPGLANDNALPHDELNRIERGGHYGWPYCYDINVPSPEYPAERCIGYRAPQRLLPAHAAPLGMLFYQGAGFPARFSQSLVITYHGYRQYGHRIVALRADRTGARSSVDLVTGTHPKAGTGVMAPVGIGQGIDGDLYFADDHAHAIFKLHYNAPRE